MFDFTPVGLAVAVAGVLFIALIGWRLIPNRQPAASADELFDITDYLAELRVPKDSKLIGTPLIDFGKELEKAVNNVGSELEDDSAVDGGDEKSRKKDRKEQEKQQKEAEKREQKHEKKDTIDIETVIVGLFRGGKKIPAPSRYETLQPDDVLTVEVDPEQLKELVDRTGLELAGSARMMSAKSARSARMT
jgi:Trk K+ transport system NAD-binding subunit